MRISSRQLDAGAASLKHPKNGAEMRRFVFSSLIVEANSALILTSQGAFFAFHRNPIERTGASKYSLVIRKRNQQRSANA